MILQRAVQKFGHECLAAEDGEKACYSTARPQGYIPRHEPPGVCVLLGRQ